MKKPKGTDFLSRKNITKFAKFLNAFYFMKMDVNFQGKKEFE